MGQLVADNIGLCLLLIVSFSVAASQLAPPTRLSVEYLLCGGAEPGRVSQAPDGIDKPYPRLMWIVDVTNSSWRSIRQTAFQVQVFQLKRSGGSEPGSEPYWDSGKVISNRNAFVSNKYKDLLNLKPLESDSDYQFKVKWYSNNGKESEWSAIAQFSTALFSQSEWQAHWITTPTIEKPPRTQMIRGVFAIPAGKTVARSRLYVTGLGYYELWQSGERLRAQQRLGPQTYFKSRVLYDSYTLQLEAGTNVIAMRVGPGFWVYDGNPSLWAIAQLHITTSDGMEYLVRTHGSSGCNSSILTTSSLLRGEMAERTELHSVWKVHDDPCIFSDMYKGEHYDARLEVPGWDKPSFEDREWLQAVSPTFGQCAVIPENSVGVVGCTKPNEVITDVKFASFGTPTGECKSCIAEANSFATTQCNSKNSTSIVEHLCLGKTSCRLSASRQQFGDSCRLTVKHLSVSVSCGLEGRLPKPRQDVRVDETLLEKGVRAPTAPMVGELSAHPMTHITSPLEPIQPVSVKDVQPHGFVFDFGVNLAGVCLMDVFEASPGTTISLMKGEELYENGTVHNQLTVNMTTVYISKGGKTEESWSPSWVYYGFQYVQVTGIQKADQIKLMMLPMTSAPVAIGDVSFLDEDGSGTLLNTIQEAIRRTQASNLQSIPTDCPNREKRGWMGDAQVTAPVAMWNYDMPAFYSNWIRTMSDVQKDGKTGVVPDVVPQHAGGNTDATWSSAYPLISYYMYQHYGDRELIEERYTGLKQYVDYLTTTTDKTTGLLLYHKYGDWCNMYPRPQEIEVTGPISACFHYLLDLQLVSGFAGVLGMEDDAKKYLAEHDNLIDPFNAHFYNDSVGGYVDGTQTVNLLPLFGHYVPDEKKKTVVTNLLHDVMVTHDMHLTTGAVGTRFLLPVLTQLGRPDVALALANQSTFPSWGYWMKQGATSLWENWSGKADATHPPAPTHDHIFLGSHGSWLYEEALGIKPALPGFEKISIRPLLTYFDNETIGEVCRGTESQMLLDLPGMSGSYDSVRGTISVSYQQHQPTEANATVFTMSVTIPPNTNASVYLPQRTLCTLTDDGVFPPAENVTITESMGIIWENNYFKWPGVPGITSGGVLGLENAIVFEVGSGNYQFAVMEVR